MITTYDELVHQKNLDILVARNGAVGPASDMRRTPDMLPMDVVTTADKVEDIFTALLDENSEVDRIEDMGELDRIDNDCVLISSLDGQIGSAWESWTYEHFPLAIIAAGHAVRKTHRNLVKD